MKRRASGQKPSFPVVLFLVLLFQGCGDGGIRRIGIPEGTPGLIVRYVLEEKLKTTTIKSVAFDIYALYDCCGSATQYALGAGRLDMAVMCPDAARFLTAKDPRYEIIGPVMFNSDIIITRSVNFPKEPTIAVSQKRTYQRRMVEQIFGVKSLSIPMIHAAVPFAFEKGVVQGAVLDIAKAFSLKGIFHTAAVGDRKICTYVLVCKRSLRNKDNFHRFMQEYARALEEIQSDANLLMLLKRYLSDRLTLKEVRQWKEMKVQFSNPLKHRLQG